MGGGGGVVFGTRAPHAGPWCVRRAAGRSGSTFGRTLATSIVGRTLSISATKRFAGQEDEHAAKTAGVRVSCGLTACSPRRADAPLHHQFVLDGLCHWCKGGSLSCGQRHNQEHGDGSRARKQHNHGAGHCEDVEAFSRFRFVAFLSFSSTSSPWLLLGNPVMLSLASSPPPF